MDYKNLSKIKYWGASTSAHQVEGGNHNQWSVWELENASELASKSEEKYAHWLPNWNEVKDQAQRPENYVSGLACNHYNLYEKDFDILESLNMNAFRFSIEWSRVEPEEGKWDHQEIEHYRKYLKSLKKRGIEPFVTLWHWTMPVWFVEKGAFEKRGNIKYFLNFIERVVTDLGELFEYVCVLNEPNVYVGMGYLDGEWPPQRKNYFLGLMVQKNLIAAHKKSYKLIKNARPAIQIGVAYQVNYVYRGDNSLISKIGSWNEETFWNYWFFNRVKLQTDFVGLNYYFADRWMGGFRPDNPNTKVNDYGWDMQPDEIKQVILRLHAKFGKPIVVTENGLADRKDKQRKWWLQETLQALGAAVDEGADVRGYLHWSLLDNFEWANGFWPRFGLVEVDYKTMKRTIRPSAKWFGEQIKKIRSDS